MYLKMYFYYIIFPLCVNVASCTLLSSKCPCYSPSLCQPLNVPARKEVFVFSTNSKNFHLYDFTKITTIAVFGEWNEHLLCFAHSKNVRVVLKSLIPFHQLLNATYQNEWIKDQLNMVETLHADGINIDFENAVKYKSKEYYALSEWVNITSQIFHDAIKGSQVTFDVAWSPNCIDDRCYDYINLAESVDFLIVMSYDEQSQMYDTECHAKPNAGINKTASGIVGYLELGIDSNQLVAGLPWYGYDYPCIKLIANKCLIKEIPFRGTNCSDAAGIQKCYVTIMYNIVPHSIDHKIHYDVASQSKFVNYISENKQIHQVWFDDPITLKYKYDYVHHVFGLRGIGVWNVDCALMGDHYGDMMWNALPSSSDNILQ